MAPLINDNEYLTVDLDDFDLLSSETHIKDEERLSQPLHVTSRKYPEQRRRVTFANVVTSYTVMNREDYTAEESQATWFGRVEMRQMKNSSRSEAGLVESGVLVDGDDVSTRGLESKTTGGLRRKRANRTNAYAAVFFELDTQADLGIMDEDAVADAYYTYSEPCLVSAHMIAVRDAEEASKVQKQSLKLNSQFGASLLFHLTTSVRGTLISSAA